LRSIYDSKNIGSGESLDGVRIGALRPKRLR